MATTFPPEFPGTEFKYPEHVNQQALDNLTEIRRGAGIPMIITGDWRPPGFVPPGGSNSSLHFAGRAFDIRSKTWGVEQRAKVEAAIWRQAGLLRAATPPLAGLEVEWVLSGAAEHLHIGFFLDGRADRLILRVF